MTEPHSLRGKRVCVIHPYPSVTVLQRLESEGCQIVLAGPEVGGGLVAEHIDAPLTDFDGVEAAVLAVHARRPIDVMLPLYEGSTALTAAIAARAGLRGSTVAGAESSRNKYLTYQRLRAAGVEAPHTIPVDPWSPDVERIAREIGFPAVIKLADSMNSQGVTRVGSYDECGPAIADLRNLLDRPWEFDTRHDRNRVAYGRGGVRVIAQPFCAGRELNIDLLFDAAHHTILGVFEKASSTGPYFPEHMSVSPTSLEPDALAGVCDLAVRAVRALDLRLGAAHVEVRFSDSGPKVLEIGARPGGGLTIDAVESLTDRHSVVELARMLLGAPLPAIAPHRDRAVLYGGKVYTESGRLVKVAGVDRAKQMPGVRKFFQLHREGDDVFAMPESAQPHFCYYLIEGSSSAGVLATHDAIRELIQLEIRRFEETSA
jgi:S-sulfo-L-cysteine synthase (3-phospho-L-serine-dependent)